MSSPYPCLSCAKDSVDQLVDFGFQSPSNRFERIDSPATDSHPLIVGQCAACGLLQLINPMPAGMAKSRFEWMTYNEPEGHLDDLVARLCRLPGIDGDSRIMGLTYKDDSTLERFNRLGYGNTYRIKSEVDLGLQDSCAGLESIQAALDAASASRLAGSHGLADVLLVRHVLEHAHYPAAFLNAVKTLAKPDGYLVFEMPDCIKFIKACDYSFIWEEHITYFCAPTLEALMKNVGLAVDQTIVYPYPLEDSLICVAKMSAIPPVAAPSISSLNSMRSDGQAFARRYSEVCTQLRSIFKAWTIEGKRAAIFGAGHLAAKFINLYSLSEYVDCVIDDNPHKQDLLMPGSRLAILGSASLETRAIDICLLSLNPESEQKVLAKNRLFTERGGHFLSIFALGSKSVYGLAAP